MLCVDPGRGAARLARLAGDDERVAAGHRGRGQFVVTASYGAAAPRFRPTAGVTRSWKPTSAIAGRYRASPLPFTAS